MQAAAALQHGLAPLIATLRGFALPREYSNVHASTTAAASSHIMNSLSHHEIRGAARATGVCGLCLLRVCRMG